jgi:hypothetical protein
MNTLLKLTCLLTIAITAATLTAIMVGALLPLNAASYISLFAQDTQLIDGVWCWRSICPGQDSFEDAGRHLRQWTDGHFTFELSNYAWRMFWTSNDPSLWRVTLWAEATANVVETVWIEPEPQLRRNLFTPALGSQRITLGELIRTFGNPTSLQLSRGRTDRTAVCFAGNVCAELLTTPRLTPYAWVDSLYMTAITLPEGERGAARVVKWYGLISLDP